MDWVPLNDELITEGLNAKEAEAVLQLRGSLPADPVPGICAGLAARIRSCVLAGGRARLGGADATYIPQALRGEAVAILRLRLLVRFALNVTEDRKREAEAAETRLDAIAKGEIPFADERADARPAWYGRKATRKTPPNGAIM